MRVVYKGTSNFQVFEAADFAKAELEQGKLTFERDVPLEVDDEVGELLTSTDPTESPLFHDFPFEEAPEEEEDDGDEADATTAKAKKKAAKKAAAAKKTAQTASGSDQSVASSTGSSGGPVRASGTGAGSST